MSGFVRFLPRKESTLHFSQLILVKFENGLYVLVRVFADVHRQTPDKHARIVDRFGRSVSKHGVYKIVVLVIFGGHF